MESWTGRACFRARPPSPSARVCADSAHLIRRDAWTVRFPTMPFNSASSRSSSSAPHVSKSVLDAETRPHLLRPTTPPACWGWKLRPSSTPGPEGWRRRYTPVITHQKTSLAALRLPDAGMHPSALLSWFLQPRPGLAEGQRSRVRRAARACADAGIPAPVCADAAFWLCRQTKRPDGARNPDRRRPPAWVCVGAAETRTS